MIKRYAFLLIIFALCPIYANASNSLYTQTEGLDFRYRWLDTKNYDVHSIDLHGLHTSMPHQFGYDFKQVLGDDTLTQAGLTYAYKAGSHWAGFGISSSSDKPFTSLNLIDFDVFYAFRIFQHVTEYETLQGKAVPYYARLFLGIEYSTQRIFLDGYPLPVIRYEYNKPGVEIIIGLPLTYIKIDFLKYHQIELKYVPVTDILFSYNLKFNKNHALKFQFEIENDRYKLSKKVKDVYFSNQEKYYTDTAAIRIKYGFSFADIVTLSPYAEFTIDGHRYSSKEVLFFKKGGTGFGYAAGIDLFVEF